MKLTSRSLYSQAREAILEIIANNSEFMSKLPSEQELSESLGVSRNTVREALKSLENEGLLASRHGVGTFVIQDAKTMQYNISVLNSTTKIIESHGYRAGTSSVLSERRKLHSPVVQKLAGQPGMDILYLERVRTADDKPVVFVEDYIPYLDGMLERITANSKEPLFPFLEHFGLTVSFSNCTMHAVLSDERLMEKLSLPSPQALLLLQQIHYTAKGEPVLYSDSYFLTAELEFNLIRKCVD